jgi:thioredoxin 1
VKPDIVAAVAELPVVGDETFEREVLEAEGPVVVDFWAPWCGPCRVVNPILEDMADEHGDRMKFLQLNVDDNPQTQARYSVLSIPTVILFEAGEPQDTLVGARARSHYESAWERWLSPAA